MKARHNPFSVDRVQTIRYRPLASSLDVVLTRLQAMNYRAAIVGPQGSGKTTLLEDLQHALKRQGRRTRMVFVNDTSPLDKRTRWELLSTLRTNEIVLLDGADTMNYVRWRSLKRRTLKRAAGLVITTHRPGWLPTLIECTTTPELFNEIVSDLLPDSHALEAEIIERLYHHHQGNIRHCLRDLYDYCAYSGTV